MAVTVNRILNIILQIMARILIIITNIKYLFVTRTFVNCFMRMYTISFDPNNNPEIVIPTVQIKKLRSHTGSKW